MIPIAPPFADYIVTLATYCSSSWIATNSENAKANARLAAALEAQFPGIIIRLAQRGAITGPDSDTVRRIDAFIDGLWLAVLSH
jgi:hypothetical protein